MRQQISTRKSPKGLVEATSVIGAIVMMGCASGPSLKAHKSGASLMVDVSHDRSSRPGSVRLAAADYAIDGVSVLSLRPVGWGASDVAEAGKWSGAVSPGEHVLEATLTYSPRATDIGDATAFYVHQKFRFRSIRSEMVRIRVVEAVEDR